MCGLFGMAGPGINNEDIRAFYDLGVVSQIRGRDSTGLYEATASKRSLYNEHLTKETEDFMFFTWKHMLSEESKKTGRILHDFTNNVFIGHERWRTVGPVDLDNTQPFMWDNIVLAHNGTFTLNRYHIDPEKSDSYLFSQEVNDYGLADVLDDVGPHGAYAVTLFDRKTRKLQFARNVERPLYFGINQKRNVMYWASEKWMLQSVLTKHGICFEVYEWKDGTSKWSNTAIFQMNAGLVVEVDPLEIKPRAEVFKTVREIFRFDKETKKFVYRAEKEYEEELKSTIIEKVVEKKEEVTEEKDQVANLTILQPIQKKETNVVPFEGGKTTSPTHTKGSKFIAKEVKNPLAGEDLSTTCGVCNRRINVYRQYLIKRKAVPGFYSPESDTYYDECIVSDNKAPLVKKDQQIIH
jgi:asparagine synthetase B (glutamine-hydrolysing)